MSPRGVRAVRALGWATLSAAPPLLLSLALVTSKPGTPPSLVTEAALASWVAGALAFGASLLHARGARTPARVAGATAALVVVAACGLVTWSSLETRVATLSASERGDLDERNVDGAPRWVHPTLGFSISAPEGLSPAPDVQRELAERAGDASWAEAHCVWAWRGDETEIIVELTRAPAVSREVLRQAADQVGAQLEGTGHVRERHAGSTTSAELEATVPGGGHVLSRILLFRHGDRAYRLLVTVVTRETARWQRWIRDVRAG